VGFTTLLTVAALLAGESDLSRLTPTELKDRGEAAFADGIRHREDPDVARANFRVAAACFEEIRRRGASNPLLYRNLGNSYLLAGNLPRAVLAYRRGLRLAPGDQDLITGLESARERVTYPPGGRLGRPGPSGQASWLSRVGGDWLIGGAVLFYFAACVSLTRWLMTRRAWLLATMLISIACATALTAVAVREAKNVPAGSLVVIADDGVLLRRGDSLNYPPRYESTVNRGVEGYLLNQRGSWCQIELSGGEVGWVMDDYLLIDESQD
jgi:hypothetical protein